MLQSKQYVDTLFYTNDKSVFDFCTKLDNDHFRVKRVLSLGTQFFPFPFFDTLMRVVKLEEHGVRMFGSRPSHPFSRAIFHVILVKNIHLTKMKELF